MSFRALSIALAAVALPLTAVPASAQNFSEGYQFIEAIRKADGTKVMDILNKPGVRIIDTKDRSTGEAALHIVAKRGDSVYLRFLLQRGANPNVQDGEGNSAMMIAASSSYAEGVQILITYKANVNLRNSKGETPLIRAVQLRDSELVRILLEGGANPDLPDVIAGMSARDYAARDTRAPAALRKALAEAPKRDNKATAGPGL